VDTYDVVGFGIATIDHFGVVDSFPLEDSKQQFREYTMQGGGTVATPLVACSRLGLKTAYLGRLGHDSMSDAIAAEFEHEGVETRHIIYDELYTPPVAMILVNPQKHTRTIAWYRKPYPPIEPEQIDLDVVEASRVLYLDAHEGPAARRAAKRAKETGRLVVVDADNDTDDIRFVLPYADVIIGSERFASQFAGDIGSERAAALLYERFGGICGITAGSHGSYLVTDEGAFHQPAFPVDVVDTTGAGDVYHGAFVVGLLEGWPIRDTATFASAVAAMKCRKLGGRSGIPTRNEAFRFLRERNVPGPWSSLQ
jgi:sugar/nucleoside kinase (ribokinase family)